MEAGAAVSVPARTGKARGSWQNRAPSSAQWPVPTASSGRAAAEAPLRGTLTAHPCSAERPPASRQPFRGLAGSRQNPATRLRKGAGELEGQKPDTYLKSST